MDVLVYMQMRFHKGPTKVLKVSQLPVKKTNQLQ